jgi:DNA-binding IscR family transcriptional regulator
MNDQQAVANALRCLQVLDQHPAQSHEISAATSLPLSTCTRLLERLQSAGLISANTEGRFLLARPIDELSPLDILDAIWETVLDMLPVQMLFGPAQGIQADRTRKAVFMAQRDNRYFSDGGMA